MKYTADRNRYNNIDPWQNNRVKLRVAEGYNDYINASPIALKCTKSGITKRYIATQVRLELEYVLEKHLNLYLCCI